MIMRNNARAKLNHGSDGFRVGSALIRFRDPCYQRLKNLRGELMRQSFGLVLVCLITFLSINAQSRDERLYQRALQIHRRAIVIDTHNDVTTPMTNDDL